MTLAQLYALHRVSAGEEATAGPRPDGTVIDLAMFATLPRAG